ncbi:MAG: methyltransferase domain-containing protein [Bacteroidota bacterium]
MHKNKKEWFATWFDSPYYHLLYQHRNENEASQFIDQLTAYLGLKDSDVLLDLACGKGRHAIQLSKMGAMTYGVDLSENSICEAKKQETECLKFEVHDMREVFKNNYFTHVFNLFTSFGYFDIASDNLKMLQSIHQMLLPNGILVIDFFNSHKVIQQMIPYEEKEIGGILFQLEKKVVDGKIIKNIRFSDQGKDFEYQEQVQLFTKEDICQMLMDTRYKVLDIFGNYALTSYEKESADRLILVAQKI